ncbi:MAG: o-succinylbenzoate synthase [Actinomycetota bacterium]|jgi:O-succinylbenzoate synthase|nr:o-succinylbenzoate synthase [Actinomycetota bacterium]MEA2486758.1 o-succinylbenzoate synthase [Actinomycetota bacterium]
MKITGVELRRIDLPLVRPFRTSFGTQTERDVLLVKVITPEAEGWGECVAGAEPLYSSEYTEAAQQVIESHLLPRLFARGAVNGSDVEPILREIKGHPMAKAALEMAILDAELRSRGESFAEHLGAVHDSVPAGVSVGIMDSITELLDAVSGYLEEGYVRIKLKIEPGWDLEPVRAVRERFGDDLMLQVDANTAYSLADAPHLAKLDEFDLLLIEQPLPEDDIRGHAALAEIVKTPICLDESITSARAAADAIAQGACQIVNIKPGRVGGYLQARSIHDVCAANGVPVWCGGMLETGLGRAANAALAALPNFTLPGDVSASGRYYERDITDPFVLEGGYIRVPQGPGLGVSPIPEILEEITTSFDYVTPG